MKIDDAAAMLLAVRRKYGNLEMVQVIDVGNAFRIRFDPSLEVVEIPCECPGRPHENGTTVLAVMDAIDDGHEAGDKVRPRGLRAIKGGKQP